MFTEKVVN